MIKRNIRLKRLFVSLIAVLFLSFSCNKEDDSIGKSDFIFKNNTTDIVYFKCNFTEKITTFTTLSGSINSNGQLLLLKEIPGYIGTYSRPTDIFKNISIFTDENLTNQIYVQNPINDSLWQHETPTGYSNWEYAKFSLIINPPLPN